MGITTQCKTLSPIAEDILGKRYYHEGEDWKGLCERVASVISNGDKELVDDFFDVMYNLDFLPNSPTLANAGKESDRQQLSACFILPVEDDIVEIMETVKNTAIVHKSGGGTGFDFSSTRPKGSPVSSTNGVASGPLSWMKIINATTEEVKQGGMRRGANMGTLRVDHPDILDFILCKKNDKTMTNFNLSVGVSDVFMDAVEKGDDFELVNPHNKEVILTDAREIFDIICKNSWESGEPGMIFIDVVNSTNPVPHLGAIKSSNPCGEFYFIPFGVCNLGSINLVNMLKSVEDGRYVIDFDRLKKITEIAVTFLDKVIDVNHFPLPEIHDMAHNTRPIGLGVMGLADMLLYMKLPYDSDAGREMVGKVMKFIDDVGWATSNMLGRELGTFPEFQQENLPSQKTPRNCQITTIAPTGTLATFAGVSFGIEPNFNFVYRRKIVDSEFIQVHPLFEKVAKEEGFYSEELMETLRTTPSLKVRNLAGVPEHVKEYFITAFDISPEDHVKMQATVQKYVDNAVSKTINLPYDATSEQIGELYMMAWKLGCKGITVYRDGSRDDQVIVAVKESDEVDIKLLEICGDTDIEEADIEEDIAPTLIDIMNPEAFAFAMERLSPEEKSELLQRVNLFKLNYNTEIDLHPKETVNGRRTKFTTGCGELYCKSFQNPIGDGNDSILWELFMTTVGGGCKAHSAALAITVSLALQGRANIKSLTHHWSKIQCDACKGRDTDGKSCPSIVANYIRSLTQDSVAGTMDKVIETPRSVQEVINLQTSLKGVCPECGEEIRRIDGCRSCSACGWTRCD
ncbi:adenosylcobalamin-dependent ribonucleoside-diphosphate reductase [Methanococcoides alaskense]|uniref:Vitamin B12-dependent ribonucleotide reductase n=1 Tax=Methanococcoides alaskense TaxID=325778 RepID=A0AA90Z9A9_9EURY|nr:adenosylcobalamin-dependent ribonucleoside-diphosphate reductase [Methanococcoides alaskense]MDA0524274.1 adenosylcobalamin-dependent ribonucleoside-diphosphate reductase [Methanococcoides alaskense]MDR6223775.1 ribonucleoside-diphosphate reductase alpha chain [Methanococcoides alaskense]